MSTITRQQQVDQFIRVAENLASHLRQKADTMLHNHQAIIGNGARVAPEISMALERITKVLYKSESDVKKAAASLKRFGQFGDDDTYSDLLLIED